MGHSNVRAKVRRRKVVALAAYSKQFTVKNTTKSISPVVEHKFVTKYNNPIVNPLTGNKFDQVNPHIITGRFGVTVMAYDWVKPEKLLWEHKRYKQPKSLIKCKKRNDFIKYFPNYPYIIKPMCKEAYMEKLIQHKLPKWEKKNPSPAEMFVEDVEKWKNERFIAEQRFRDFVVSCYDKLKLNGRFKTSESKYTEEQVAEIKDINGEGHHVNELDKNSKLMKKAQKITNETKKERPNLVSTNLKDHKQKKGRIILPEAA